MGFGLVQFPVKLFSAAESTHLGFRLLCAKCNSPIHYKRWCSKCKKEIEWENVVKGLEISKGQYFVLTKERLEQFRPEKTDLINIIQFVDAQAIDPLYYEKSYFVIPGGKGNKAYFLFKEVLQNTAKVAIARFVMKEKEHICAIESYKKGMLLTNLMYQYEIRDINKVAELQAVPRLSKEEMVLAKQIIKKLYEKEFDMSEFKDTFAAKLKEHIKKSLKAGKKKIAVEKEKKPKKEKNLIAALKATIKQK